MPTPLFSLRLSEKAQKDLVEMARVYGAPNASAFAREMLEVMTGGDIEKVKAFVARLVVKSGEQLTIKFNAVLDGTVDAQKRPKKRKKGRPGGKEPPKHGRRS